MAQAKQLVQQSDSERTRNSALNLLASLQAKTDPDAAAKYWERLATLNPQSIQPLLAIARIRKRQHNSDEARRFFRAALDGEPEHAEALIGYGQALADFDHTAAIDHFVSWSRRQPRDVAPLLELARLHQKSQEWDRAEAAFREILARTPDDRGALLRLAQNLSRDPSWLELALDLWHRIAERDPASPLAPVQRAYLFERARRPGEAETEYRAALQRAPEDSMALIGLARLLAKQERWREASTFFEASHRASPDRVDALLGLGRCLERLDQGNEALIAYQKVLALDPANGNAQLYRGRLLRQLGRSEEAIEAWRDVCVRTPQNADAWHELVFMLGSAERDTEAVAALDAGEAALPKTPASWIRLGLAAQAGQFHDRAVGYFQRAIAAEPQEPSHHARLGGYFFRQGVVDGAFHHLLASRELKPNDMNVAKQLVDTMHTLRALGIDPIALNKAPPRCGEVLAPERLFRLVREIADTEVTPYE
ncbi:MAG: tetratricopeptide repeat protein, partial [Acidobacteriota bacterium]